MSAAALEEVRDFLRHQHGMILVVGPTGSGKTTTLSSALKAVQSEKTNIITIEDPVEYQIPGVNQTQINEKIKLTFASALRSILRQDPDVILVGEIRDAETAKIAMQAAQTGHLVLSTLHTDDAPSVVTRLMDIGTEPYVIASALVGVVAQRLVRRLCVHCRRQYTPPADTLRALNITEADAAAIPFYKSVGCDQCNHTGYRGRIGIYEVMRVTDKLRRLIAAQRVRSISCATRRSAGGMITLGEDGLAKVKSGITTPEELLRVVTEVREMRTLCPGCGSAVGVDFIACPQCGKRRRRRLPALRPRAAARLELLPVLRAQHDRGQARGRSGCASATATAARPPRAAGRQRRGVQEVGSVRCKNYYELLEIAADGVGRRDQAGVPRADRALPSRQGPAPRQGIPGHGGRSRRRAHRGVPHPLGRRPPRGVRPRRRGGGAGAPAAGRRRRASRRERRRRAADTGGAAAQPPPPSGRPAAPRRAVQAGARDAATSSCARRR